jgi:TRAP-type mannitol/chloroaromatic compound transport system permease small subunit
MGRATTVIDWLDGCNRKLGRLAAWLVLGVVMTAFGVVLLRYGLGWGRIWLQEAYLWMHAAVFTLGAAYTLAEDGHVRIDLVYAQRGPRYRAVVNLGGALILLVPFTIVLLWTAVPYVRQSWIIGETSREAGGLPALYLLKSLMLIFAVTLLIQAAVLAFRSFVILADPAAERNGRPRPSDDVHAS